MTSPVGGLHCPYTAVTRYIASTNPTSAPAPHPLFNFASGHLPLMRQSCLLCLLHKAHYPTSDLPLPNTHSFRIDAATVPWVCLRQSSSILAGGAATCTDATSKLTSPSCGELPHTLLTTFHPIAITRYLVLSCAGWCFVWRFVWFYPSFAQPVFFHDPRRAFMGLNIVTGLWPYLSHYTHRALPTNGSQLKRRLLLHTNRPVPILFHLTNVCLEALP